MQQTAPTVKTSALAAVIAAQAQARVQAGGAGCGGGEQWQPVTGQSDPASASVPTSVPAPRPVLVTTTPAASSVLPLRDWADCCVRATSALRSSIIELSYYGYKLREAANWESAGYESEATFRDHLRIEPKQWQKYMTLGERIGHLSPAALTDLSVAAAEQLTLIHPRVWPEYAWVEEARVLSIAEFRALIEQRNQEAIQSQQHGHGDPARQAITILRPKTRLPFQMNEQQAKRVTRRVEALKRQQGIRAAGDVLEFVLSLGEQQTKVEKKLDEAARILQSLDELWSQQSLTTALAESATEQSTRYETGSTPATSVIAAGEHTHASIRQLLTLVASLSALKGSSDV